MLKIMSVHCSSTRYWGQPQRCTTMWLSTSAAPHTLSITEGACGISGWPPLPRAHRPCHSAQGVAN